MARKTNKLSKNKQSKLALVSRNQKTSKTKVSLLPRVAITDLHLPFFSVLETKKLQRGLSRVTEDTLLSSPTFICTLVFPHVWHIRQTVQRLGSPPALRRSPLMSGSWLHKKKPTNCLVVVSQTVKVTSHVRRRVKLSRL